MADLILSLEIVVWLQIRINATDDNIYSMKEESDFFFCGYQQRVCQVSRAKCSVFSQSDRLPLIISNQASSPAKLNILIDSTIFLRQPHTVPCF